MFWQAKALEIYKILQKEIFLATRKTLASSLVEVMKLVDMRDFENQEFFIGAINNYLQDIEEIKV